jgi:hypothetical protein
MIGRIDGIFRATEAADISLTQRGSGNVVERAETISVFVTLFLIELRASFKGSNPEVTC